MPNIVRFTVIYLLHLKWTLLSFFTVSFVLLEIYVEMGYVEIIYDLMLDNTPALFSSSLSSL